MTADMTLVDVPISIKDYRIYDINSLPKLFFGFRVKSKFDEARLKIKSKYKPRRVTHFRYNNQLEPIFMYGIEVAPNPQYKELLDDLNTDKLLRSSHYNEDLYNNYKSKLGEYDLSCDECYRYACDGMYPIDNHHLDRMSKTSFKAEMDSGFSTMINRSNIPWFLSIANFNLYALCVCTDYDYR
tara:strand:- start:1806 stop:2357 length:552 start_codon:yes stop_codon:yes gene_type:complete